MANATLPKIIIAFKALAASFVERSERGVAILIVREEGKTVEGEYVPVETRIEEVTYETDLTDWSNANAARIADMLDIGPAKVVVLTMDTNATVADATAVIEANYPSGRVTIVGKTSADYSALSTWAKAKKTYHALIFSTASQDNKYVENVYNQSVTFDPDWDTPRSTQGTLVRGTVTSEELLPMICAILSKANVNGASSTILKALKSVVDVASADSVVNAGNLILYNDWNGSDRVVRLGTAVNTLTTFDDSANDGDQIEDMRYIEVAEAADMIRADIKSVFRDSYIGQKNSVDNQMQLIGAIGDYYDRLEEEDILNSASANTVEIDVDAQRAAWITVNPEAADWDDDTVRSKPFKRKVFIKSDIQILQSIQDLSMKITLN